MPNCLNFTGTPTQYVPADLRHDTNGWYIVYYEFNPILDGLERKRVRLNMLRKRCKNALEFRVQTADLIRTINSQILSSLRVMQQLGQQPVILAAQEEVVEVPHIAPLTVEPVASQKESETDTTDNLRYYTPVEEMIDKYIAEKKKETREATFRSYKSANLAFKKWMHENYTNCKCIKFSKSMAVEYLDFLNQRNDIGARTYNNNLKMICATFAWAVKKCYVKENPFMGQDLKRAEKKQRTIIPPKHQAMIDQWFADNDKPAMRIVMRMVFTSLLRPVEASRVQVKDLDFKGHCIHMPGNKTKNWSPRDARMDSELEDMLREHIKDAFPTDYLFGYGTWRCGQEPINSNHFTKEWERMRAHLLDENGKRLIPNEFQLYSLRDTSINGMIKGGIDDLSVMQAAGHNSLEMTKIYADHEDPNLIRELNARAPKLGEARHTGTSPQV